MPVPVRLLDEGEEVVVDVRPHAWALAGAVALAVAAVLAAGAGLYWSVPRVLAWVLVGLLAVALLNLVGRYLRWRSTCLVVTTLRVIRRRGIIVRTSREIPLAHITDVSYEQTLFERLIRAGDVRIESAGRDSAEVFVALPRPAAVEREITRLLTERDAGATPTLSLPEQLERLEDLRRRGVLSQQEFEATKARLLGSR
jgi:uncharacterized membrane protein YdbT with pleckstrin-like domain